MPTAARRTWTLASARALVRDVRARTAQAVGEVEALIDQRGRVSEEAPERAELEARIQRAVSGWVRAMEAYGVEVKGPWRVDFDNGRGYYCWCWPEEDLEFYRGHDEGYRDRVRIQ